MRREFVGELLTLLEHAENRALSWGFLDGGFVPDDVERLISREGPTKLQNQWTILRASGLSFARLLDDMRQAGLLYQPRDNPSVYRTRFAETIRLLSRLRQMFRVQDWQTAPRLVRNVKIYLKPRIYPKRNLLLTDVWDRIRANCDASEFQKDVFYALSVNPSGMATPYAGFQARAFARILGDYGRKTGFRGSVISAGTGSGKTKAFYVPALMGIADDLVRVSMPFTKVIAIYPRNVLLADQLREAVSEASKLRLPLASRNVRAITIGALLGDTPPESAFQYRDSIFLRNWTRLADSWVVPFIKSPVDQRSDLVWRDRDRVAGRTALYRRGAVAGEAPVVEDGVLTLTRESLQARPPDILFVSLEMLNQELGNPQWARAFGIENRSGSPRLLLLDEIHSYAGLSGAQVPWILRRWILACNHTSLHIVGLSATLRDAVGHLVNVTGLSLTGVEEISPIEDADSELSEFVSEGAEYNVAVRGNTSAGAQLLATSIQAAMLLSRVLTSDRTRDASTGDSIEGAYYFARKVFGFTDNLDTLNRWMSDLVNADNQRHLASLRSSTRNPSSAALREGQVWELPEVLGHDLRQPVLIDRCSSQEPGVDPTARLVLATSSLEVGYDDPEVGIVLQHKAPSSMASFVQRKGRAGRRRGTRPMTVVVLSDFGKDRSAYRDSHRLFGDSIERLRLPSLNPYVMKIQAAWLLLDWIGRSIGRPQPLRYLSQDVDADARCRTRVLLKDILAGGEAWERFSSDLRSWLKVYLDGARQGSDLERHLDIILWETPRPLLRQVVPALLKDLEAPASDPGQRPSRRRPIPEYIPERTFHEIDSHEIRVEFLNDATKRASLESSRFLQEFCPGRVSKRFSIRQQDLGYWPVVSNTLTGGSGLAFDINAIAPDCTYVRKVDGIPVYEPHSVQLVERPRSVKDSSQGSWVRQVYAEAIGDGLEIAVLQYGPLSKVFEDKRAYLHRDNDGIRLIRYSRGGNYEVLGDNNLVIRGNFSLQGQDKDDGEPLGPQAIGYERVTDGIIFSLNKRHLESPPILPKEVFDRLRADLFLQSLLSSDDLRARANNFAIGYLWQTSLAMLSATALSQRTSLRVAQDLLRGRRPQAAAAVIGRLLGGADDDDQQGGLAPTNRHQQIVVLWGDPVVQQVMDAAERTLWETDHTSANEQIGRRYIYTLAAAINVAVLSLLPDIPEDDIAVDVLERSDGASIVVSETTSGGLGHIEALVSNFVAEPSQFEAAIRAALLHCTRSQDADTVLGLLSQVRHGESRASVSASFARVRSARSFDQIEKAKDGLRQEMRNSGLSASRESVAAIMASVLRPGTSPGSDRWCAGLNTLWKKKDGDLGIAIPIAVFAYWCSRTPFITRRFHGLLRQLGGHAPSDQQVFLGIEGLLHDGCHDSCSECLGTGEPSNPFTKPSRSVALHWIGFSDDETPIRVGGDDWLGIARTSLRDRGRVTLSVAPESVEHSAAAMGDLLIRLIETEYLSVAASLTEVRRKGREWIFVWQVRGLAGGA